MQNKSGLSGILSPKAFTLIELLVVVLIIGILAAIALPQYQMAVLKSRYTQLMAFGNAVHTAALSYHLANGTYPSRFDELSIDIPGTGDGRDREYQDYKCHLYGQEAGISEGGAAMRCWLATSSGDILSYFVYLSGTRYCGASYQWKMGNNLCKSITNTSQIANMWGNGNAGQNYLYLYAFN